MNTNQFFSFNRFWLLLRNDILLNYKKYLLTILGMFIVGYVILYWNMPKTAGESHENNVRVFQFGIRSYLNIFTIFLLALGLFVGLAFPKLTNKVDTSSYLLLPASTFEKFMHQFLFRMLGGLFVMMILFWLDANLARLSALRVFEGDSTHAIAPFHYSTVISRFGYTKLVLLIALILFIGVYQFSVRIFFNRMSLLKTLLSFAGLIFLLQMGTIIFSHLFFPEQTHGFGEYLGKSYHPFDSIDIANNEIWMFSIFTLSWLFLFPLGYFKLKEKQV